MKRDYVQIFRSHCGDGPWPCFGCDELVRLIQLVIHHINEDHHDDRIENLAPMHRGCHATLHRVGKRGHMTGKHHTSETKARMSVAQRRRWETTTFSDEARARISAARRAAPPRPHTADAKRKIGEAAKRIRLAERRECDVCGLISNAGAIARHKKARHQDD